MTVIDRLKTALGLGAAPDGTERREHPRVAGPLLTLRFGGGKYKSVDWSLGGCRLLGLLHGLIGNGNTSAEMIQGPSFEAGFKSKLFLLIHRVYNATLMTTFLTSSG